MLRGFLLSYIKYGDHNAILHCFTLEDGYGSFFVRGIYSPKNKKKAYLQPLYELSLTLSDKSKYGSIKSISKIELEQNTDNEQNIKINTIIFFIADFLNHILRNESQNPSIYEEISVLKEELKKQNYNCHLIFLFKILEKNGLSPLLSDFPYLNPESGNFEISKSNPSFDSDISLLWKNILTANHPYDLKIEPSKRSLLLDSLLIYYHYHFVDFRTPNSLEIVKQIFD